MTDAEWRRFAAVGGLDQLGPNSRYERAMRGSAQVTDQVTDNVDVERITFHVEGQEDETYTMDEMREFYTLVQDYPDQVPDVVLALFRDERIIPEETVLHQTERIAHDIRIAMVHAIPLREDVVEHMVHFFLIQDYDVDMLVGPVRYDDVNEPYRLRPIDLMYDILAYAIPDPNDYDPETTSP